MQDPTRQADTASQWKTMGVNIYVGIWSWPTDSQAYPGHVQAMLDAIAGAGAQAVAGYDGAGTLTALGLRNGSVVKASLLGDEPDMNGTSAAQLAALASTARSAVPSRPTYVNFSKGIVNGWNLSTALSPADKQAYCASANIASVDFYGFTDPWEGYPGAKGYARAMDAMKAACGSKPIWGFVETTRPFSDGRRITADQFEVAVWTLLASGADGIELFSHDFGPGGMGEDALLRDPAAAAVKARAAVVGSQLAAAAELLNRADKPAISTSVDVKVLGKEGGLVVTNMSTSASSTVLTTSCAAGSSLRAIGGTRTVTVGAGGGFSLSLNPYEHLALTGTC
jgi:hypothetical protein